MKKYNIVLVSLGSENYSYIDKYAPVRIMGYDYSSYRKQIDDNKFPLNAVITIVLNFTSKRWNRSTSLHNIINVSSEFLPYIPNYNIHVFDVAFLDDDTINRFTSDFRHVARFFKSRRLKNKDFLTTEKIHHVSELLDLLSIFTNDIQYRKIKNNLLKLQTKGRDISMCYIVEEFESKGRKEGIKQGQKQGIKLGRKSSRLEILSNMFTMNLPIETIISLGFSKEEIQTVQKTLLSDKLHNQK